MSIQRVHWDMLDLMGILHNAAFLLLFERARTDFWRDLENRGYSLTASDWPYLVARNEIDYRAPIGRAQDVRVTVQVAKLGRSSITFAHEVYRDDDTLAAVGQTVLVRIDPETQRPIPWTDMFRTFVTPYLSNIDR